MVENRISAWRGRAHAKQVAALLAGAVGISLVAACGGTPTSTDTSNEGEQSAFAKAAEETTTALQKITSDLESVTDPQQRRERLIEMAKDDGGELTWYTSTNESDAKPIVDAFQKATGVKVNLYRAGSTTARQRAEQESQAGRIRADNISLSGVDPAIAAKENLFAPLDTPATDNIIEDGVFDTWVADQIYPFVPAWNTDLVPAGKVPTSYEDLFTSFPDGGLAFEVTDGDWLFGLVQMLKDQGMSEDDAIALVKKAAASGRPVDGHTLMAELLAAGEYPAVADAYHYRVEGLIEDGAPIAWKPVGPVVADFGGSGISATASNPAAALLFLEYQLTDVQDYWVEAGRTPSDPSKGGGIFAEDGVELWYVDYDALMADYDKWQGLYEDMMQSSGREVEAE